MVMGSSSEFTTNSKIFNNFRASPPDIRNKASVSFITIFFFEIISSVLSALSNNASKSVLLNEFNI